MNKALIAVVLALVGCASSQIEQRYLACEAHTNWMEIDECRDNVTASDPRFSHDTVALELLAYKKLLREKVQNQEMTEPEAGYAFQQKKTELYQRREVLRSMETRQPAYYPPQAPVYQQQAPIYQPPTSTKTECRPELFGNGFECTTEPTSQGIRIQPIQGSNSVNPATDAFNARTQQLQQQGQ